MSVAALDCILALFQTGEMRKARRVLISSALIPEARFDKIESNPRVMPRRLAAGRIGSCDGGDLQRSRRHPASPARHAHLSGSRKQPGHDYPDIRSDDQADAKTPIEHLDYLLRLVGTA